MTSVMDQPLSVWLLPAEPLRSALAAEVARLGEDLDAPPFLPHVTLIGNFAGRRPEVEAAVEALARARAPLAMTPRPQLASSRLRFEALTVRFQPSPGFDELAAALRARLGLPAASAEPHLSLAYPVHTWDPAALPARAEGVSLHSPYVFDALTVVDPGEGRSDWSDVAAWRCSARSSALTWPRGEA